MGGRRVSTRTDPANSRAKQRAFLIAAQGSRPSSSLEELGELLATAGVAVTGTLVQVRDAPDPDRYLGGGKILELGRSIKAAGANLVACDDELSPRQERNLERDLGVPVIDRTAVILDIFASHATTAEGKLQVELAQLEYNLARMRGLWTHLERLGAGIGTRGPGESQIETDRRLARDRIAKLRRRLKSTVRTRSTMRGRRERSGLPSIALAGYTNAGKSSLMNAITGADAGVGDRLFHTLDPKTRSFAERGRQLLLTDTVGFIGKLPHQLIDAFHATLEETRRADLICHVLDSSRPEEDRLAAVQSVERALTEIGAEGTPRLLILNKIDLLNPDELTEIRIEYPEGVAVSAATGEGVSALRAAMRAAILAELERVLMFFPHSEGSALADLYAIAGDLEREETADGVLVRAGIGEGDAQRFDRYRVDLAAGRALGKAA